MFNKKSESKTSVTGIKIHVVDGVIAVVMCLVCLVLIASLILTRLQYRNISRLMEDYVECNKAVSDFSKASEKLTTQCRFFIINQKNVYLDDYYMELNRKSRETAIEILELTHSGDLADVYLKRALTESYNLQKTECYAIRLVCDAIGFQGLEDYPLIDNIRLTTEDINLSAAKKTEKAQNMIFASDYIFTKSTIDSYINEVLSFLISTCIDQNQIYNARIHRLMINQIIFIVFLIIFTFILHIALAKLVFLPLINSVKSIENGVKMKMRGAYEYNYIAKAYNDFCDKNILNASILKHKAEHDPLTGLINREAFSQIKDALRNVDEEIAYLLVDIDFFKSINDKYGHLVGDDVLRKISSLLMEQFRTTDYVARIGGDEFAVIMTKFGDNPTDIIQRKISGLNTMLQNVTDGLPSVSLSVGVAFSESGYKDCLFAQADEALYTVKRGGRCNCSFFSRKE